MTYNAAAIYEVLSLAINHHGEGRFEEAEKLYRVILNVNPNHADANYNFAILAVDLGYIREALPFFEKAIEVYSVSEQYYVGYIDALIRLEEMDKARVMLEEAKWISSKETIKKLEERIPKISVNNVTAKLNIFNFINHKEPTNTEVQHWNTLYSSANYRAAEEYSKKMTINYPNSGVAWKLYGVILTDTMRYQEALNACITAVKLLPNDAETHYNLGVTFQGLKMFPKAAERYNKAIELDPNYYRAYGNLGIIVNAEGKFSEAIKYYMKALEINPTLHELYNNLAATFNAQGRHAEARAYYYKALEMDSTKNYVFGNILFSLNYDPDVSSEDIFSVYQEYDKRFLPSLRQVHKPSINDKNSKRKLKIGYVSPDFCKHPVQNFLIPLLENHDKECVEIYGYAELDKEDEVTQMYKGYCDHWLSTAGMSDEALAECIQSDGIDILVELAGHTNGNRLGVFARKPAPISLSWLGYGYTTGLSAIDYYLCDEIYVPKGSESLFSEKPWRLESPSFSYTPALGMQDVNSLPYTENGYITFGTLTRAVRINHRTIRVWAELLKRVPNSKLIINSKDYRDPSMREALIESFQKHGIERERLKIGYHSPPWPVLARMDIGVDCFPHNSGTTLFETLYMGVPYVTLADRVSVGRLGGTILHAIGRDEWIANSEEEYIDKLVALAEDPESLASIRAGLRNQMIRSPLMDAPGFARKLEKAYQEMFTKWCKEE